MRLCIIPIKALTSPSKNRSHRLSTSPPRCCVRSPCLRLSLCAHACPRARMRLCSCVRKSVHKGVTKCTSIVYCPDLSYSFHTESAHVAYTTHAHMGRLLICGPRFAAVPHVMLAPIIHEWSAPRMAFSIFYLIVSPRILRVFINNGHEHVC